ncbi:hypothetical protein T492DRAFT_897283 [Pavlovales sp. CCMP2436]|nr:hypothetical protein T492DRAFT_897283 [Pavlovales sp. CCMP2436]
MALKLAGVHVAINFSGDVQPVLKLNNKFDCILREMPSLLQLTASLPRFVAQRASVAGVVLAGAQCRISRTFQQESWQLHFVCNDGNASMLARNAVLLHLSVIATPEAVLAVWANHGLGSAHASALRASCAADEPWPDWLRATAGLSGSCSDAAAEAPLREACCAWATCNMTLAEMLRARDTELIGQGTNSASHSQKLQTLVKCSLELSLVAVGGGSSSKQLNKEIGEYLRSGSLTPPPHSAPNITLLISFSLQYCNYIPSSIVRALPLGGPPSASLATRLLATISR